MKSSRVALPPWALAVVVAVLLPGAASAGIKCWTNHDGVRECGNVVPPEYAQKSHREMTEHGITVSTTKRAKTKEELRIEREEAARTAAARAEEDRKMRERKTKDRVLLSTFTTEKELEIAHQGQVAAIDIRIGHAEKIIEQQEQTLGQLRGQAAKLERSGKKITPDLKNKIANTEQQIEDRRQFIESRRMQKATLAAQYDQDLSRYRELKGTTKKAE